jgi:hypothetical protein
LQLGYYAAFLKVNTLFKRLIVTVDAQNVSLLHLNNSVLKIMGPTILVAVMARHTTIFDCKGALQKCVSD